MRRVPGEAVQARADAGGQRGCEPLERREGGPRRREHELGTEEPDYRDPESLGNGQSDRFAHPVGAAAHETNVEARSRAEVNGLLRTPGGRDAYDRAVDPDATANCNRRIESSRFRLCGSGPWDRAGELLDELHQSGVRRVSVEEVLDSADRVGRRLEPDEPPLAAIERPVVAGFGWDVQDTSTPRWFPQGITTSHDAGDGGLWAGREVVLVSWALDGAASVRLSFVELGHGAPRYCHVLLVEPVRRWGREAIDLKPIRLHAGGIVWRGPYLYVADTRRGVRVFAVDEMLEVATGRPDVVGHRNGHWYGAGHRFVMPQVGALRLGLLRSTFDHGPRFSFLALSRDADGAIRSLISGEYRNKRPGARLVSWPVFKEAQVLGAGATIRASAALTTGRTNLQGALPLRGHLLLASSGGGRTGSGRLAVYEGERLVADHSWATGPEALSYLPARDVVLSLTEHQPGKDSKRAGRVVFGVRGSALVG